MSNFSKFNSINKFEILILDDTDSTPKETDIKYLFVLFLFYLFSYFLLRLFLFLCRFSIYLFPPPPTNTYFPCNIKQTKYKIKRKRKKDFRKYRKRKYRKHTKYKHTQKIIHIKKKKSICHVASSLSHKKNTLVSILLPHTKSNFQSNTKESLIKFPHFFFYIF